MDRSEQLDAALEGFQREEGVEHVDPEIRELVRLAARLYEDREALRPERRAALRARILRALELKPSPTFGRRLADGIAAAGRLVRPAPALVRGAIAAALVVGVASGTSVVSASALPGDPLYGVKVTTERMRVALATDPEDRVAVELDIAEQRLREALRLAELGRDIEAEAAASSYAEHVANAAAAAQQRPSPLLTQVLRQAVSEQQRRAEGEPSLQSVEVVAQQSAVADVSADQIAEAAAQAAELAAEGASLRLVPLQEPPVTSGAAARRPAATARPATTPRQTATPLSTRRGSSSLTSSQRQRIEAAVKGAKEAAQRAKQAAERAKRAAGKAGPTPRP